LDETVLGDHLDLVQQIVPTNEEIRYVREQIDIDLEFDEAGKFFMQFLRFKDLPDRVRLWAFKRRFEQVTSVLHDQIATISKACAQLLDEKSRFVEFLSLVLTLGNYLNSKPQMSSTPKMHFGFQLSSLTKLKDTKSTDKRTNLLQFLAQWISREHLHLRDFYQDVATVSDAARVPVSVINQEHLRCKRQLSEIRNQLATISQDSLESDSEEALFDKNYYDLMNLFVGKATSTMIEIDRLWEQMKDELKNIALLYCEKEAEIVRDPQAWFLMLDQFVETYKSCLLERRK
jgi:diaphanous 3